MEIDNMIKSKLELLIKPVWENTDIKLYANCGSNTAVRIHQEAAIVHGGVIKVLPKKVKRDAVLKAMGLDPDREIGRFAEILKEMKGI